MTDLTTIETRDTVDAENAATHCKLNDGGFITRTKLIPWTRLNKPGLEGIQYKILNFDENRGYLVVLNTFDPGSRFAPHKHMGAVEIFMLSGSFFYDNGQVFADDFMLAIFHGPLQILDDGGNVLVTVGIDEMYALAKESGAVAHLTKTEHRVALTAGG
jgi:2,4'-dihydroxyacetophenone dioxygenase